MAKWDGLTDEQIITLAELIPFIKSRRGCNRMRTDAEIYTRFRLNPVWRRVVWTGGIGTWRRMRSGKVRILLHATESGIFPPEIRRFSLGVVVKRRRIVYRYGWCLEF